MSSKKIRLKATFEFNFQLIGVVSSLKEYKVGWMLNQLNYFHLKKGDDIKIEFDDDFIMRISNLMDETDHYQVHLLKNRLLSHNSVHQFLIPELKRFDFLLKIYNETDEDWSVNILSSIRQLSGLDYIAELDIIRIKNKENLLF